MLRKTLLVLAATFLAGCPTQVILPDRPVFECRVEPVLCRPGSFGETRIDTSRSTYIAATRTEVRLAIDQVAGLDGPYDEFSITFEHTGRQGLATIRGTSEALHQVRLGSAASAVLESVLAVKGSAGAGFADTRAGPYGSAARSTSGDSLRVSPRNDRTWLTARLDDRVRGDYDIFEGNQQGSPASPRIVTRLDASSVVAWDAQPAISPDERTLYFVSDRRGGFGGTDIYLVRRMANGEWSPPENLGPGVNTPCDELSPFVDGSGRWLYFSSSGHATVGGYDIFRAPILGEQFGAVENLGMPINTPADEIFPSAPRNASTDTLLYYSSNQQGADGFDMFVLHRLLSRRDRDEIATRERNRTHRGTTDPRTNRDPRRTTDPQGNIDPALIDSLRLDGIVLTSEGDPVDRALVTIEGGDPPYRDSTRTDTGGNFKFWIEEGRTYDITSGPEGRLPGRRRIYIPPSNRRPVVTEQIILPDTITFRVNFPFNNATDPYEYTLDDRGIPTAERWVDVVDRLARFLRSSEGTTERVEIVGHTDPVGSDPFNLDLGRRRAEFVRRQLILRGVRPTLLILRSEGESRPLPQQQEEPEELYHARLRRVELVRR